MCACMYVTMYVCNCLSVCLYMACVYICMYICKIMCPSVYVCLSTLDLSTRQRVMAVHIRLQTISITKTQEWQDNF